MTRTSKIILSATLALGLIGGGAAYAKYQFASHGDFAAHMVERVSDKLDLNAMQEQSLEVLANELVTFKAGMKRELRNDRQTLCDMLAAPQFDQAKAIDMLNSKTNELNQNAPALITALGSFLNGLSAEQRAEIIERFDHHKGRHHGSRWFKHDDDKNDD
ncbi:MAG: protein CpxP [Gammaproteobacteria bacterium]|jgi:protein CpxP